MTDAVASAAGSATTTAAVLATGSAEADDRALSQKKILNRLRRAQGQLTAVIAAVENEASCAQVVTQLSAVSSALDKAGFAIISSAMRTCIANPDDSDDNALTVDELEKLFLSLA